MQQQLPVTQASTCSAVTTLDFLADPHQCLPPEAQLKPWSLKAPAKLAVPSCEIWGDNCGFLYTHVIEVWLTTSQIPTLSQQYQPHLELDAWCKRAFNLTLAVVVAVVRRGERPARASQRPAPPPKLRHPLSRESRLRSLPASPAIYNPPNRRS